MLSDSSSDTSITSPFITRLSQESQEPSYKELIRKVNHIGNIQINIYKLNKKKYANFSTIFNK